MSLQGVYRSGQTGQTVNLLAYAYVGSNPTAPIVRIRSRSFAHLRTSQRLRTIYAIHIIDAIIAPCRIRLHGFVHQLLGILLGV